MAFSAVVVSAVFSVVASELSSDTKTSAVVETTDVLISLFAFYSDVQAVNVPVAKINVNIIAIFFFMLIAPFKQQIYPKNLKCPAQIDINFTSHTETPCEAPVMHDFFCFHSHKPVSFRAFP